MPSLLFLLAPLFFLLSVLAFAAAGFYRLNKIPFQVILGTLFLLPVFYCVMTAIHTFSVTGSGAPYSSEYQNMKKVERAIYQQDLQPSERLKLLGQVQDTGSDIHPRRRELVHRLLITDEETSLPDIWIRCGVFLLVCVSWGLILLMAWRIGKIAAPYPWGEEEERY